MRKGVGTPQLQGQVSHDMQTCTFMLRLTPMK